MAESKRPDENGRGLGRAFTAPVRAVTKIWATDHPPAGAAHHHHPDRSAVVDCAVYVDGIRRKGDWGYAEALRAAREQRNAFVWLGLHEPTDEEMVGIAEAYGLHPLAVEDAINAGQRPKLEQFGDVSFLALRTIRYVGKGEITETSEIVETGHVMLFIGEHFVITVRHGDAANLSPMRAAMEHKHELLKHGPWAVAYAVADLVVDLYLEVALAVENDIDVLEESVFARQGHGSGRIQRIYQLKREMVEFKRAVIPLQRPMMTLVAEQSDVPREIRKYFRDVQDHLTRTVEQVNSFDDLLHSILQARLAQVTVDQNDDMRKIAAWAAIAAVQTAIAGIYGMNFRYMPELDTKYGYPVILALMFVSALALYRFFRRAGWL